MAFAASGNTEKIGYLTVYWSAQGRGAAETPTIAVPAPSKRRAGKKLPASAESLLMPFPLDCGHVWRVFWRLWSRELGRGYEPNRWVSEKKCSLGLRFGCVKIEPL